MNECVPLGSVITYIVGAVVVIAGWYFARKGSK